MKAVLMRAPGGPEVLELAEVPDPVLTRPDQVKVRLHAAGLNPVDTKVRAKHMFYPHNLPVILGCDGAGEVVEAGGEAGALRPGDRVWFCNGGLGAEPGNYAEYNVIPAAVARPLPESLGWEAAAAAPLVLLTAWEALFDRGRLESGQTVLIHAGAGGVGHVAIQLAKWHGARVLTTVSGSDKASFVRALGADEVIDYRREGFVERTLELTAGRGADLVLDTVGPEVLRASIPAVAHYGDLVTLLDPGPGVDWGEARIRNLRLGFTLMLTPMLRALPEARARQGEILDRCAALIDDRRLRIEVGSGYALADAAEAHRALAAGHTLGKRVLRCQ